MNDPARLVVILGPTASGKSALGIDLDAAELRATGPERPVDFDLGRRKPAAHRRAK